MDVKFLDKSGNVTDNKKVSDAVFSREYSESLVHQLVESFRSNSRGGNRAQKDRSEVKFSTRKPWKQKGTGRARAGRASSPIWRSGGKVFPSSPTENFTKKVNKKMYKAAMQCIFSQLVREDRLFIISEPGVSVPKTKQMVNELQGYKGKKRLIISKEVKEVSELASRNIQNLKFINCSKVDPLVLLNADFTYVSEDALEKIEESFI